MDYAEGGVMILRIMHLTYKKSQRTCSIVKAQNYMIINGYDVDKDQFVTDGDFPSSQKWRLFQKH